MSFSAWFRQWVGAFLGLLSAGAGKHKSNSQRKKERERRLKAKYSNARSYRVKQMRRAKRNGAYAHGRREISAFLKFMATSLGILLLPFGLLNWLHKNAKARGSASAADRAQRSGKRKSVTALQRGKTERKEINKSEVPTRVDKTEQNRHSKAAFAKTEDGKSEPSGSEAPADCAALCNFETGSTARGEDIPKSTPKVIRIGTFAKE